MSNVSVNDLTIGQKQQYAKQALAEYQNLMVAKYGEKWNYTLSSLIDKLAGNNPDFLNMLGAAVYTGQPELSKRRLNEAMERVSDNTSINKLPSLQSFMTGLTDELTSFDFSIFSEAALDVAKDIVLTGKKAGESIGKTVTGAVDTVGFLGSNLKYIIPGILALAAFVLYKIGMSKAK